MHILFEQLCVTNIQLFGLLSRSTCTELLPMSAVSDIVVVVLGFHDNNVDSDDDEQLS